MWCQPSPSVTLSQRRVEPSNRDQRAARRLGGSAAQERALAAGDRGSLYSRCSLQYNAIPSTNLVANPSRP